MTLAPTLPTGPLEHPALDYDALRAEALELLDRLTDGRWTDRNPHDPGLTILEQLCYAITDLAYRATHSVPDLFAGAPAGPGPAEILTCDPVTEGDLRRLVLDEPGVQSVQHRPADLEPPVFFHAGSRELHLVPDPSEPDARPLALRGLTRLALQSDGTRDDLLARAAARLHAQRPLGEDLELQHLQRLEVALIARIEVRPTDDPAALLAELLARVEDHLTPRVPRTDLADALAEGRPLDQLLVGPALRRGLILGELPPPRRSIRASDVLHLLTDHPAVRAVRSLALASNGTQERWVLPIPDEHVPVLAGAHEITLLRGGLALPVDLARAMALLDARRRAARAGEREPLVDLPPPRGRDRQLARYRSVQRHFPAVYGIGPLGLPASASPERRAQARQLGAYLLIFDQLLAGAHAQLAHARVLLSPDVADAPTYVTQPVDDPDLDLRDLLTLPPAEQPAWLARTAQEISAGRDPDERRKRFLAHLLARFGEQVGDYTQISGRSDRDLLADRQAFLRQIARLGGARGSGRDLLDPRDAPAGLELRLRLRLGLRERPRLHLVEHFLLRPIVEDRHQREGDALPAVPLLAGLQGPDPWSGQVSFVFEAPPPGAPEDFERMVQDAILAETPAHLRPQLHWFDAAPPDTFDVFDAALAEFRAALRAYRGATLRRDPIEPALHLRLRHARDRVVDLLGLGRTYPLRDLPVPPLLMVPPDLPAEIALDHAQPDVVYTLCDEDNGAPILHLGRPIESEPRADQGTVVLRTPPVTQDVAYRILATKRAEQGTPQAREAWLHTVVRIEEGVDPRLVAQIQGPLLDPGAERTPSAARLLPHGATVRVDVLASQEGVDYELVDALAPALPISPPVRGTGGVVTLSFGPAREDLDLRVRATRDGDGDPNDLRRTLLQIVLPLRVSADPALPALALPALLDHGERRTPVSLFAGLGAPPVSQAAAQPYELGVKLRVDRPGHLRGVRFFKPLASAAEHRVRLWRADGVLLADAALPDALLGWQEARFAEPVALTPDTTYVISYFTPAGSVGYAPGGLTAAGRDVPPLHALRSGVDGPNGVFHAGGPGFPDEAFSDFDYWVDPIFAPLPAAPILRLKHTQTSAEYRLFRRPVRDRDVVLEPTPAPTLTCLDGAREVTLLRPDLPGDWNALEPLGPALPGTGGDLDLPLGPTTADAFLFVQVRKYHRTRPGGNDRLATTLPLAAITPVLVRPDPERPLVLRVTLRDPSTAAAITLLGGQPGVAYELRAGGVALDRPLYFHQRDVSDPALNKGITQLVLGADFVVARRPAVLDPGHDAPHPPELTLSLALPTCVHLLARKAFTRVAAELAASVRLDPLLGVHLAEAAVPPGGATQVHVEVAALGATYELYRGDALLIRATGTGAPLDLPTGPIQETTAFDLVIRQDLAGLTLERRIQLTVELA